MKLKTKKVTAGEYQLVGTDLLVVKGLPPRYRHPQEWFIVHRDHPDAILLIGKGSKANALWQLERLLLACGGVR